MKKKINFKNIFYKKENVAILTLALVFCVGMVVNGVRDKDIPLHDGDVLVDSLNVNTDENTVAGEESTLEAKRASVDMERNKIVATIDETINSSSNETEKKNAIAQKERLVKNMKQEVDIESIILTKDLPASFVLITDSSINVTVDEQDLKQNIVAKICDIVMRETGRTADKIIIQSCY